MNITIVRPDNVVIVDGEAQTVDCSHLPTYVSVIQWRGDKGWIEFVNDGRGAFMPNCTIVDIAPYRYIVDAWREAKMIAEEKARTHNAQRAAADAAEQSSQ